TMVEVVLVMSFMAVLFGISILSFSNLERKNQLELFATEIKSTIYQAKSQTINGIQSALYLDSSRYVLFRGETFSPTDPENQEKTLPSTLQIVDINLPNQTATFVKVSGYLNNYSSPSNFTLRDITTGQSKLISINKLGIVNIE
ncbi:hypothetical protein KKC08_03985, partial [Patescibacteria group bacterium]|nr:hypothetical protein [Patescibacteria group bacterium]MBU4397301.1 hypothetical protein [Patescibacteria group bacterium]